MSTTLIIILLTISGTVFLAFDAKEIKPKDLKKNEIIFLRVDGEIVE